MISRKLNRCGGGGEQVTEMSGEPSGVYPEME